MLRNLVATAYIFYTTGFRLSWWEKEQLGGALSSFSALQSSDSLSCLVVNVFAELISVFPSDGITLKPADGHVGVCYTCLIGFPG